MRKSTKILTAVIALCVAGLCVAAGYSAVKNNDSKETTTAKVVDISTTNPTTTAPTTTLPPEKPLSQLIIGKWTDSAGLSGFEFFSDGKVSFTYANLSALGINFDGTVDNGTYKLKDNILTITYSIYTATIENEYEVSVEDDILKMINLKEGDTSTYVRAGTNGNESTTGQPTTDASIGDELHGSWENKSMSKKYKFVGSGKVVITLDGESFDGVYVTENNKLTIQYTAYNKQITEKFTFSVTTTSLLLTNEAGSDFIFTRAGTEMSSDDNSELLGLWRDSADMSGYEFKENGVVEVTFVNLKIPVIDLPVNGTFTGAYSLEGNKLSLTYYIYGNAINESYTYSVDGNTLRLTDGDGDVSTYMKK